MYRRVLFFSVIALTLAAVPALAQTAGRPGPPAAPRRTATRNVVGMQQAQKAFRDVASQKNIAFRFPADGCYARAHLMVRRLLKQGYKPSKVWSFPGNGEQLYVRTRNDPRGHVSWKYHVAPVLKVRTGNNRSQYYVLDPSLFNRPVTINEWLRAQKKPGGHRNPRYQVTQLGQAPRDASGKQLPGSGYKPGVDPPEGPDANAIATMRRYKPFEGKFPPRTLARGASPAVQDLFWLMSDSRRSWPV
jgi:hypothetical protein